MRIKLPSFLQAEHERVRTRRFVFYRGDGSLLDSQDVRRRGWRFRRRVTEHSRSCKRMLRRFRELSSRLHSVEKLSLIGKIERRFCYRSLVVGTDRVAAGMR